MYACLFTLQPSVVVKSDDVGTSVDPDFPLLTEHQFSTNPIGVS